MPALGNEIFRCRGVRLGRRRVFSDASSENRRPFRPEPGTNTRIPECLRRNAGRHRHCHLPARDVRTYTKVRFSSAMFLEAVCERSHDVRDIWRQVFW